MESLNTGQSLLDLKFGLVTLTKTVFYYRASEGKTVEVPYRGDVEATIMDILGGLRSACTYTGAARLKELPKRTTFIRVTQQTNEIFSAFSSGD